MNTYDFGKFLSQLRKDNGLTQMELASKLNVTDKAVSRWETGKNYPDIEIFEDLSRIFKVSVSELLEGKRIEKENLLNISEKQIVTQIKKNKKAEKKYLIIIAVVLLVAIFCGYFTMKSSGIFDDLTYYNIPCYSNDVLTNLNNAEGFISQRKKAEGDFIIDSGFLIINGDKTSDDVIYLSGTCQNGRGFYVSLQFDSENSKNSRFSIAEYRKNKKCAKGIPINSLKKIVAQLDLSEFSKHERFDFDIGFIEINDRTKRNYDGHGVTDCYILSNGVLESFDESTAEGEYMQIRISGMSSGIGSTVACVYYKIP